MKECAFEFMLVMIGRRSSSGRWPKGSNCRAIVCDDLTLGYEVSPCKPNTRGVHAYCPRLDQALSYNCDALGILKGRGKRLDLEDCWYLESSSKSTVFSGCAAVDAIRIF